VSRQLGQTGQDGLIRAKFDDLPRKPTTVAVKLCVTWLLAGGMQADEKGRKSKERLEEEKRAILKQRIRPLDIDGADASRLADKAKELLNLITRLESEKYDLEKSYKARQMEVSAGRQLVSLLIVIGLPIATLLCIVIPRAHPYMPPKRKSVRLSVCRRYCLVLIASCPRRQRAPILDESSVQGHAASVRCFPSAAP